MFTESKHIIDITYEYMLIRVQRSPIWKIGILLHSKQQQRELELVDISKNIKNVIFFSFEDVKSLITASCELPKYRIESYFFCLKHKFRLVYIFFSS